VGHFLRTLSLLKNQPVFESSTGTKIGEVCDLGITDTGVVKGLLIKKGALFKQTVFLDIKNISSYGHDGIMIENKSLLEKPTAISEYTLTHQHPLNGKVLLTKSGETLGLLQDVYFLEELGTIVGYEVTDGFFSDIMEGIQVIQSGKPPAIGKDAIIVDVNHT